MNDDVLQKLMETANTVTPVRGSRMAAVLVDRKGRVISEGQNKKKSHPFQGRFGKNKDAIFLHAETECILNYLKSKKDVDKLPKLTMYVARAKRTADGKSIEPGMAKPCEGCQRALATFGITKVYYTTEEGYDYL